jgi:hypothetical protein
MVNTVHELRALPLGLGGVASMRRNDLNRTRALLLARDSVARYAKKHEPEDLQRIQRVWNRDKMQRTPFADSQGWAPTADDTAEALGLKGHALGRILEDCVGEDVPKDLEPPPGSRATRTLPNSLRTRVCLRDYEAAHVKLFLRCL